MEPNPDPLPRSRWILYVGLGWLLGVLLVVGFAVLLESLELGWTGQFVVGLGMALGVGSLQGLALCGQVSRWRWMRALVLGLATPYALADGLMYITALKPERVLPFATVLGAVLAAWLQARSVGAARGSMGRWVLRHAIAWLAAYIYTMGLLWASHAWKASLPHSITIIMAFGSLLTGGLVLGMLTHGPVVRLLAGPHDHSRA